MSTLLIVHGDEGCPSEIHAVILIDQTLSQKNLNEVFEAMTPELYDWIGEYDQPTLTRILHQQGLTGKVLHCIPDEGKPINKNCIYYEEMYID